MPVFVDHELRRRQVVSVASRLIAEAGLDAVTVRDIAEAADCSTAIVSHYFHNKKELLFLTYKGSIERAKERSNVHLASGDLKAFLAEIMPLDEERLIEWKIWLAFWAKAVADREIAEAQRACVRSTRGEIQKLIERLQADGDVRADVDAALAARQLLTLIMGMAVEAMFDSEDWSLARQHELIDRELRALYAPDRIPSSLLAEQRTAPRRSGAARATG
jgi:AcrR family transcriptional regulator